MWCPDPIHPKRLPLGDVVRVQAGYMCRTRVQGDPGGTHRLLQSRDVSDQGEINLDTAAAFCPERNPGLYRVTTDDILILARGHAHLVQIESGDTIASSVFHIIRPDRDAVLPGYLFFGTGIPAAIVIFNRGRKPWAKARSKRNQHVLFIDASREFESGTNQNRLRDQHIAKIVGTFDAFKAVDKYAYPATRAEIEENEFNFNIPRYVDTFEPEPEVDIPAVRKEIATLEDKLAAVQKELAGHLKELGL